MQGGKYTIEKELRRGRFGITYLVKNKNGDRQIIKTLDVSSLISMDPLDRDSLETRFCREAVILTFCKHQYIVQFAEFFKEAEHWCLVMEYVAGVILDDLPLPLPEKDALDYIQQIGEALTVVHENNLIHGDVRPENIILRVREGIPEAVLVDFDFVHGESDYNSMAGPPNEKTRGFRSPELHTRNSDLTGTSDIYSLAATLYVLLTGKKPVDVKERIIDNVHLVQPQQINPKITDHVNKAILMGMEIKPEKRPKSVIEWLKQIEKPSKFDFKFFWNWHIWNWDKNLPLWTLVISAIAAFGTLLSGMAGWIPIFKVQPDNPPLHAPNPMPTKKPYN
ncbi:serine/threonine protein kinase [Dolichospermum flos-aquae]|uniref:serine/threonine protein kinase n=1 Tax=Dolichospermum flosaquae TaxID=1166 RepID=UPI001F2C6128|nr:serine/threonine-protein kinase [Dolichospermum flos-aquae]